MNDCSKEIVTVPNFWDEERCRSFIAAAEIRGIVPAAPDYPPHYRNNDRQVLDDEKLADSMFNAVKKHLPSILVDDQGRQWKPVGVNSRFRLCRYRSGQFFGRHRDGVFHVGLGRQTMLSLLVYLNGTENFSGGRTRFFSTRTVQETTSSIVPKDGLLALFPHELWHDGEPLDHGTKYVLRSDVIFECVDPSEVFSASGHGHQGYVWQALALDNRRFMTGGRDRRIVLWELDLDNLPKLAKETSPQLQSVTCLVKLNSDVVVAGSRDRSLALVNIGSFSSKRLPNAHAAAITQLAPISEEQFASACAGGVISIRDADGQVIRTWRAHEHWIWGLVTNEDRLVSVAEDGVIAAWNKVDGSQLTAHRFLQRTPSVLAQGSDGTFAVGFLDGGIEVGRLGKYWEPFARWQAHTGAVRTIAWVAGTWISGGEDYAVRLHDLGRDVSETLIEGKDFVRNITPVGGQIIVVGYNGGIRRIIRNVRS